MDWYVYVLYDKDGDFYIGKGTGNRMYQHVSDTKRKLEFNLTHKKQMRLSNKERRIAHILLRGDEVKYRKVLVTRDEAHAYAVEAQMIREAPFLTNVVGRLPPHQPHAPHKHYKWNKH